MIFDRLGEDAAMHRLIASKRIAFGRAAIARRDTRRQIADLCWTHRWLICDANFVVVAADVGVGSDLIAIGIAFPLVNRINEQIITNARNSECPRSKSETVGFRSANQFFVWKNNLWIAAVSAARNEIDQRRRFLLVFENRSHFHQTRRCVNVIDVVGFLLILLTIEQARQMSVQDSLER